MISTFPAIPLGPLHYRNMAKGNFDAVMPPLPFELNREIIWWEQNSMSSKRDIIIPQINCFITTDARSLEWGQQMAKYQQEVDGKHLKIFIKAVYFAVQA